MTNYKKVDNCGPVPYPDRSGRFLTDGVVSGEEWIPYLALGFIEVLEKIEIVNEKPVAVSLPSKVPVVKKPARSLMEELKSADVQDNDGNVSIMEAAILAQRSKVEEKSPEVSEEIINAPSDDGERSEVVDSETAGSAAPEDTADGRSSKRRGRRGQTVV